MRGYLDETCSVGAIKNPVLEDARKEAGKDGDDVEAHELKEVHLRVMLLGHDEEQ